MKERLKLLYIMGMTRSGSTLLDRILGHFEGFVSVGEFYTVWDQYLLKNRLCGCNTSFDKCPFWQDVFGVAFGGLDRKLAEKMAQVWQSRLRIRHLPYHLFPWYRNKLSFLLKDYSAALGKLYDSIGKITDAKVIVDSSKNPTFTTVFSLISSIDVHVIHLIRDPRAVAFSWSKVKQGIDGIKMDTASPFCTANTWTVCNLAGEILCRQHKFPYLRVRYEDFISNPQNWINRIVSHVNEDEVILPFDSNGEIELGKNHNLEGNPDRFQSGKIKLKLDEAWKEQMKHLHKYLVSTLTWPLLKRYE